MLIRMPVISIPANPNCPAVEMRLFHDLEPPRPVRQVRLERRPGRPEWCEVTGWTSGGASCPALLQKVDDSGEGVAWLLFGGDAGLRFRRRGNRGPWTLADPEQWGEPFLLMGDLSASQVAAREEA